MGEAIAIWTARQRWRRVRQLSGASCLPGGVAASVAGEGEAEVGGAAGGDDCR